MALSNPTNLTTLAVGTSATTVYTTASVSPASNCLLIATITTDPETSPDHVVPTVTTGLSNVGTWTWYEFDSTTQSTTTLIGVALVTGAPGSGTVTFTFGTQRDNFLLDLSYVTGHNTTTPVAQSIGAGGIGTAPSATFGATPSATSLVYVATSTFVANTFGATSSATPGAGFTEVSDIDSFSATYNFSDAQEVQYLNGSATTAISSTILTPFGGGGDWSILGIEINQAGGGGGSTNTGGLMLMLGVG